MRGARPKQAFQPIFEREASHAGTFADVAAVLGRAESRRRSVPLTPVQFIPILESCEAAIFVVDNDRVAIHAWIPKN